MFSRHLLTERLVLSRRTFLCAAIVLSVLQPVVAPAQSSRGLEQVPSGPGNFSPGSYYALVIGIDSYPAPLPALKTAVHDAESVATVLREHYGFQVTTLLDQDATRDKILEAMAQFRKRLSEDDSLLIYYAGHGSFDRETGKGYWLPVDAHPDPLDTSHDISADDITTEVRGFAARHVLIISDSCFSGDLSRAGSAFSPSEGNEAYIRRMLRAPSRTIMASGSDEPVSDSGSEGHSIFAVLLLQALQASLGSNFTAEDLFASIRKSVLARSGQSPQYAPLRNSIRVSTNLDNGDFVFTRTSSSIASPPPALPAAAPVSPAPVSAAAATAPVSPAPVSAAAATAPVSPAVPSASAADEYSRGMALWKAGRYSDAASVLTSACDDGSAEGCSDLGAYYASGKDFARAATLWRKACDGGSAISCSNLAMLYATGSGVAKDFAQAATLYRKGCDGGNAIGCGNLAMLYENGSGVSRDFSQAATLLRKACDGGYAEGCSSLGLLYATGNGVTQDFAQTATLWRKACDNGSASGCGTLGILYERGNSVSKDPVQAAALYRKACDGGFTAGCWSLGLLYENGNGVAKDLTQAATVYSKACDGGIAQACSRLGTLYASGNGMAQDFAQAATLFRKACDGGDPGGCGGLGVLYESGEGMARNPAQAAVLYRKACDGGLAVACDALKRVKP